MGLKRLVKKTIIGGGSPVNGHIVDALLKKKETGRPFTECIKESVRETWQEDMPGISDLYQAGRADGRVQGTYEQAQKDEKKFRQLHDKHEKERKRWYEQKQRYEDLLDEVEKGFD